MSHTHTHTHTVHVYTNIVYIYIYLYIDCTQTLTQSTYIYIYMYIYTDTWWLNHFVCLLPTNGSRISRTKAVPTMECWPRWINAPQRSEGPEPSAMPSEVLLALLDSAWCHCCSTVARYHMLYIYVQTYNIIYHNTYIKYIHLQHVSPSNHIRNDSEW